jgi:hypothetical protein
MKIQILMFPGGFSINPVNIQYLTSETNQLFHLTSRISSDSNEYKNEIPTKNDEDYRLVAGTRLVLTLLTVNRTVSYMNINLLGMNRGILS